MVRTTRPEANGATVTPGGAGSCYAEFGWRSSSGGAGWETTKFDCTYADDGNAVAPAETTGADGEDCSSTEWI